MVIKLILLLALCAFGFGAAASLYYQNQERECGGDISNLWLEVVIVVDNSNGMLNKNLDAIAANIATIFGKIKLIGEHYKGVKGVDERSTRVALVTYNQNASVAFNLDHFQSAEALEDGIFESLSQVSSTETSYVATGLGAAEIMFKAHNTDRRQNFRKVVIVYASTYKGAGALNPVPFAKRLRTDGVQIITIGYSTSVDSALIVDLGKLASKETSFSNKDLNLNQKIERALAQANCHCPNEFKQYRQDYNDKDSSKFGTCLLAVSTPANRRSAANACQRKGSDTYLANEYTKHKHDFVATLAQETLKQPLQYFIGLQKSENKWYWDQPKNVAPKALDGNYVNWMPKFPNTYDPSMTAVWNYGSSADNVMWENASPMEATGYVCEKLACDTDNYCEPEAENISQD